MEFHKMDPSDFATPLNPDNDNAYAYFYIFFVLLMNRWVSNKFLQNYPLKKSLEELNSA